MILMRSIGYTMIDKGDEVMSEGAKNFFLATDYETGRHGKLKDLTQAANYMIKAAELGHCLAVYNVAAMYIHGRGVPRDLEIARAWALRLRALGGLEFAEKLLAAIDEKENQPNIISAIFPQEPRRTKNSIKRNLFEFSKSVGQALLGIFLLASIGYCSGGRVDKYDDLGEIPDHYRKP